MEIERLQPPESGTKWYQWRRRRWEIDQFDRQTKRLVTASEIMGLAPRQGYLKSEDRVVRLSFPSIQLPRKQAAFVERKIEQLPKERRPTSEVPYPRAATTIKTHDDHRQWKRDPRGNRLLPAASRNRFSSECSTGRPASRRQQAISLGRRSSTIQREVNKRSSDP